MYLSKFGGNPLTCSEDKAKKKVDFYSFKGMDGVLENLMTWKIISRLSKSYQLFKFHNDTIYNIKFI